MFQGSLKRLCIWTVKPGNAIQHAKRAVRVRGVPWTSLFMNNVVRTFEPLADFDSSSSVRSRRWPNRNGTPSKKLWRARSEFVGSCKGPSRNMVGTRRASKPAGKHVDDFFLQLSSIVHQAYREGTKTQRLSMLTDGSNARKRWLTANSRKLLRQRRTQPT